MSDILGPQQFGKVKGEVFLGREQGHEADYSAEVAATVDSEVRRLIDTAHDRARLLLDTHRDTLDLLARTLVEKETLEDADLDEPFGTPDKGTGKEHPATDPPDVRAAIRVRSQEGRKEWSSKKEK